MRLPPSPAGVLANHSLSNSLHLGTSNPITIVIAQFDFDQHAPSRPEDGTALEYKTGIAPTYQYVDAKSNKILFHTYMMYTSAVLLLAVVSCGNAFPFMADFLEKDVGALDSLNTEMLDARAATCATHTKRKGAAPYSKYYPSAYTGAKDALPGTGKGGVLVPAKGDTAHAYLAPSSTDILSLIHI